MRKEVNEGPGPFDTEQKRGAQDHEPVEWLLGFKRSSVDYFVLNIFTGTLES
jgi:hypothetical protein